MMDARGSSASRCGRVAWWIVAVLALGLGAAAWSLRAAPSVKEVPVHNSPGVGQPAGRPLPAAVSLAIAADTPVLCWSQHTAARFEPCGCVAGMFGGLARRATVLASAPAERILLLEGGGWSAGPADHQRLKSVHYLSAARAAGVDACAIGKAEVALGLEHLRHLAAATDRPPLLCLNLRDAAGDSPLPASLAISAAGRPFIVTAIAPLGSMGAELTVVPPEPDLLALVAQSPPRSVVVMADLDLEGLRALALAVPGLGAVVGGEVDEPSATPERIGGTPLLHVANHGKTVGWWPWDAAECAFDLLGEDIPDDPRMRARIVAYQEALGTTPLAIDRAAASGMARIGSRFTGAYVGSQACAGCHADAASVHRASRHGHAFATLVAKNYHRDPECLACHVTGLGQPGGYVRSETDSVFAEVSCESCHGPGGDHVAAGGGRAGHFAAATAATCVRCHDRENSPHFAYPAYWPRIQHGR